MTIWDSFAKAQKPILTPADVNSDNQITIHPWEDQLGELAARPVSERVRQLRRRFLTHGVSIRSRLLQEEIFEDLISRLDELISNGIEKLSSLAHREDKMLRAHHTELAAHAEELSAHARQGLEAELETLDKEHQVCARLSAQLLRMTDRLAAIDEALQAETLLAEGEVVFDFDFTQEMEQVEEVEQIEEVAAFSWQHRNHRNQ